MSDCVLYPVGRLQVRNIENGANLRRLGIYLQRQYLVSTQALAEGLSWVVPWGIAKGLSGVVPPDNSYPGKLLKA